MKDQCGSYQIKNSIQDQQGLDNTFDHQIPVTYGNGVIEGKSRNCKVNVEYKIEKLTDIYKAVP